MTEPFGAQMQSRGSFVWGPLTRFALAVAAVTAAVDQAAKIWLLFGLDLPENIKTFRIVGIVRDAKFAGFGLRRPARPMFGQRSG